MRILRLASLIFVLAGCGDDDGGSADAPATADASGAGDARGADSASGVDAGPTIDSAPACILPTDTISGTVGDNSPCTAECAGAYCYQFGGNPPICTNACSGGGDCPSGWTCNSMGRCRNP